MTKQDWDLIQSMGFTLVLNLESGFFELSHLRVNDEFQQLAQRNITPVHLEMSDVFPPTSTEIAAALSIIKRNTGLTYVHCLHGVDRTGVICAAWRVAHGWTVNKAIDEMLLLGFHKFWYGWWLESVRERLASISLKP